MINHLETMKSQTLIFRELLQKLIMKEAAQHETIPPTWQNNLHWHAGHLVVTPCLLIRGLGGRPLGVPSAYRKWFAKDTNPSTWASDPVPSFEEMASQILPIAEDICRELTPEVAFEPFPTPYLTTPGILLNNAAEALSFSLMHDGIHAGLIIALNRALRS